MKEISRALKTKQGRVLCRFSALYPFIMIFLLYSLPPPHLLPKQVQSVTRVQFRFVFFFSHLIILFSFRSALNKIFLRIHEVNV